MKKKKKYGNYFFLVFSCFSFISPNVAQNFSNFAQLCDYMIATFRNLGGGGSLEIDVTL